MSPSGERGDRPVEGSRGTANRSQLDSAEVERFRALADHATELMAEFDEEGRYLYASPSYRTLLGLEPSELIGTVPHELIHPEDRRSSRNRFDGAIESEAESRSVHRLRPRDGSWRWFDNTGRAYRAASGEMRFVSLGRDITERKLAEEGLARRLAAEQRLLDLSRHLLSLDSQQLVGALEEALAIPGELASADRVYLAALRESDGETDGAAVDLYERCPPGEPPLTLELRPWLTEQIRAGRLVHCETLTDLPDEAELPNLPDIEGFLSRTVGFELFPKQIYYLDKLPVDQNPLPAALVIAAIALVISFIASLIPAWKAARLDPVETLRYE